MLLSASGGIAAPELAATLTLRLDAALSTGYPIVVTVAPRFRIGPIRTVRLDAPAGPTVVVGVAPGRYRVRVDLDGRRFVERDVDLAPSERLELVVTARSPGGDLGLEEHARRRFWLGTMVTREDWRGLPSGPLMTSLLETADPTAVADRIDHGGLGPAEPPRLAWRGTSWTQTRWHVGAFDVTDPAGGVPVLVPEVTLGEPLTAVTAGGPVEVRGPGAELLVCVGAPAARWRREIAAAWVPLARSATRDEPIGPPPIAAFARFSEATAVASGPVRPWLGLTLAATASAARRFERGSPGAVGSRLAALTARGSTSASSGRVVDVVVRHERRAAPFPGRWLLAPPMLTEQVRLVLGEVSLRGLLGRTAWTLAGGYARHSRDARARAAPEGGTVDRLRDGPVPELPLPGQRTAERGAATWTVWFAPPRWGRATHEARAGMQVTLTRAAERWRAPSLVGERIGGRAAFAWRFPASGASVRRIGEASLFAADRLTLGHDLVIEAGLRLERTSGSARDADTGVRWLKGAPRLALDWTPRRRLSLGTSYGRFVHRLLARHLAWGDSAAPWTERFRWSDADGDGRVQSAEIGRLVARGGPGALIGALDPRLAPPVTTEVAVRADVVVGRGWRIGFAGVRRAERDLIAPINIGVPPAAYRRRLLFDPGGDLLRPDDDQWLPVWERSVEWLGQDRLLLTNPPNQHSRHEGVELWLRRTGARADVRIGATAARSVGPASYVGAGPLENDQGLAGEGVSSPNASTFARGRLFFDRAYTLKLATRLQAPGDVHVGVVARYQDGQPFARLVLVPDLVEGPELVRAVPNGRHRFSYLLTVDARVEKALRIGGVRVVGGLDVFNLLDAAREVEEDVLAGPAFRQVVAVQPPRTVRVRGHVEF